MDIVELRQIINKIESVSKEQARVDTGTLERSIYGIINEKGIAEFGEMFYGQFGTNSRLAENINKYFPKNEPYKLIYYDFDGGEYVAKERTKRGRIVEKEPKIKDTEPPKSSTNIRKFINYIKALPIANDINTPKIAKNKANNNINKFLKGLENGQKTNPEPKARTRNNKK